MNILRPRPLDCCSYDFSLCSMPAAHLGERPLQFPGAFGRRKLMGGGRALRCSSAAKAEPCASCRVLLWPVCVQGTVWAFIHSCGRSVVLVRGL